VQEASSGALFFDVHSVAEYARLRQGRGRPMSAEVAWAALWLLSGFEVDWLSYQAQRRLYIRLREIDAKGLVWSLRRRAVTERLRIDTSFFDVVREKIVLTGVSSAAVNGLELTVASDRLEGYIPEENLRTIIGFSHAVPACMRAWQSANFIVRAVGLRVPSTVFERVDMPIAVVAVDLAMSSNTRERSAGLCKLEELLDEWRSKN